MEPLEFRYDTQLLIEGQDLDEDEINDYITEHFEGDCLLAVGDEELIKITPDKILENVASYYSISVTDITGKSKQKCFALPRQVSMYLCKNLTDLNFTMIARILGNRDRTTVMYAVDKIAMLAKEEPSIKRDIENITKNINSIC